MTGWLNLKMFPPETANHLLVLSARWAAHSLFITHLGSKTAAPARFSKVTLAVYRPSISSPPATDGSNLKQLTHTPATMRKPQFQNGSSSSRRCDTASLTSIRWMQRQKCARLTNALGTMVTILSYDGNRLSIVPYIRRPRRRKRLHDLLQSNLILPQRSRFGR